MDGDVSHSSNSIIDPVSHLDDELVKYSLKSDKFENREYYCTFNKLGKGAYSKVYKGYYIRNTEVNSKEWVAIKKMNMEQINAHNFLENEIKIMERLNHPNILNMIDVIERKNSSDEKVLYIILELCGGGDLKKMVRYRRMYEKYAVVYFKQIANGLEYLRSKNIIHRDLKPHNVLLSADRKTLKIADFGFAKIIGNDVLAETMCGSPLYMAPEILLKRPYTSKADLWSVGVMLYEVLCGIHPFKSVEGIVDLVHKVEKDEIKFPSSANISSLGIDLLKRLLKKDPHERIGWTEFFNHRWFKMFDKPEDTSMSNSTSLTKSTFPIIENYNRIPSSTSFRGASGVIAMSPPSFINSPMVPNEKFKFNIIDNYDSNNGGNGGNGGEDVLRKKGVKIPYKYQSMPILPFEREGDSESQSFTSSNVNQTSIADYLGTSLKMLRDSFQSQTLH